MKLITNTIAFILIFAGMLLALTGFGIMCGGKK